MQTLNVPKINIIFFGFAWKIVVYNCWEKNWIALKFKIHQKVVHAVSY